MEKTTKAEDRAGNVIELRVKRLERRSRQHDGDCVHHSVTVDPTLNTVHCNKCGKEVNATAWILMLADHWDFMRYTVEQYKRVMAEAQERKRCTCQHCGKVTEIKRHRRKVIPYTGIVWKE